MKFSESKLQSECVKWFRLQYPNVTIFAIPNGGNRDAITGAIMKREGALAGVADLFVMKPSSSFCGLFIEMKIGKGKQSDKQLDFQQKALASGYQYKVITSIDQFIKDVKEYLYE
jgi:hypothetical protein